jgi:hypothetical protein
MCFIEKESNQSFLFFEEPMVTGDIFLAVMENTALHHVLGTVFQLDLAPPHFSHCVHVFLDRELRDH